MEQTIDRFLQDAARRFDDRAALSFKPGFRYLHWSYREVWEGAGRVAALLQQRGVAKGDRVIIWGPNSPHWVLAYFGMIRAGAIVVPLDMRSTPEFAEQIRSRTEPAAAFVSRLTPPAHETMGLPEIYFEELEEQSYPLGEPRPVPLAGDDLAEIMFTSGTTGDAKGVMLTHRNLLSNLESVLQVIPGDPSLRLLSLLPLSHMFEQMGSLFSALSFGANITFATSRQPAVLLKLMQERKITMMLLVPQALDLFMKGIEREVANRGKERVWELSRKLARHLPVALRRRVFSQIHARFGGSLRTIVSGGAALEQTLGEKWNLVGISVLQGYGATEASPVISTHSLEDPRFDSVGRPVPGVDVRIADDGEIQVRGPNITQGYWKAPEQTARAFDGEWYKTGDLGYLDAEGYLHIQGRKKDMIVLADGRNVYPEDVEEVLKGDPAVTDATVIGLEGDGGPQVHAVFLLEEPDDAGAIVARANQRLGDHQRIRGFTVWPEADFPRTHTLKVKKAVVSEALRGGATGAGGQSAERSKPAADGDPGERLVRLVSEVSGVPQEQLLPEKSLGGDLDLDSLKRVELLSVIEQELGVYIDESLVGSNTTFGELLRLLRSQEEAKASLPPFYTWPLTIWFAAVREVLFRVLLSPVLRAIYRVRVQGREHLHDVSGSVLFAANHNAIRMDSLVLIKATPRRWRRQLAFAAAAEITFGNRWRGILAALVANAFPLSRDSAIRASLQHMGRLMDEGWSVVLFPEGEQRLGGPMQPFQSGTGMLSVESRTPVVPVHIVKERPRSLLPGSWRARVSVRFGAPLTFPPGTSYLDATQAIEDSVRAL